MSTIPVNHFPTADEVTAAGPQVNTSQTQPTGGDQQTEQEPKKSWFETLLTTIVALFSGDFSSITNLFGGHDTPEKQASNTTPPASSTPSAPSTGYSAGLEEPTKPVTAELAQHARAAVEGSELGPATEQQAHPTSQIVPNEIRHAPGFSLV